MALEASERTPSMQAWLGLLHPPQLNPKNQKPKPATRPKKSEQSAKNPSAQSFPWFGLCILLLGYLPTGIIIGLSNSPLLGWGWPGLGALTWVGAGTWGRTWVLAFGSVLTLALAGLGSGPGNWGLALAWGIAGGLAGATAGNEAMAEYWMWVGWILGSCLAGTSAGYFTGIGIWAGLGMGVLALAQSVIVLGVMDITNETLKQYNNPLRIFMILSIFSLIGIALGGGFGWWLKLSGVRLPI